MQKKILIVEDEAPLREGLSERPEAAGYRVQCAATREEGGADDYVTKPFHLRELLARIENVLARPPRPSGASTRELTFGPHHLDLAARRLLLQGKTAVSLTKLEFDLLRYLIENAGRAIDRRELLDRVWGYDRYPTTRTVDFHVLA